MFTQVWQLFTSTLAAFFGVQSDKNRHRDFGENESPIPFIIMGIVMAILLVLGLVFIVSQVTS
ncbi:DUF2970 domain-containing protein [Shewanella sp. OPT22]|nr:DUF2970 domain-containing protein [Shewanella sp. OPT22]